MKRIVGLFVLTFLAGITLAQNINQNNVPAVVLNTFQLKSPNATDIKWKLVKGNYQVGFEVNNKDCKLVISDRGTIMQQQQDLYISEIPSNVMETIRLKVAFFDFEDADKVEEGGKIIYDIELEINGKDHDFWIDENGKLLKYIKEIRDNEVPASITSLITNKYGLLDIDDAWFREESGNITYRLRGEINDMDHNFIFNNKTTMLIHDQDLRNTEIPVQVINAAKTAYNGYEIRDADLREEGRNVTYRLAMRRSKERFHIIFSPEGKIIEVIKR
jgi:uncharacterized membrane protein YkoI